MTLTATQIKTCKPGARDYTLNDGQGLSLLVRPNGSKLWRYRKTVNGKQILRGIGQYPEISLAEARSICLENNKSFALGIDPLVEVQKQREKTLNSFENIAREWYDISKLDWSEKHAAKVLTRLENNIFPFIGKMPIDDVKPSHILKALQIMQNRRAIDLTHRMHQICSRIFRYAIATERAEQDSAAHLKYALIPNKVKNHASLANPKDVSVLLQAIDSYEGTHIVRCAFKLSPLLFPRPGELRHMEWSELNFDQQMWRIPAGKMKMKEQHLVPLSRQSIEILESIYPLTGQGKYVFPGRTQSRPMSENTIGAALKYLGYSTREQQTAHGFRSMASTMLNEAGWHPDAVERQLAHAERDEVRGAYNYAEYLPIRIKMMQWWADYLDALKNGTPFTGTVISFDNPNGFVS